RARSLRIVGYGLLQLLLQLALLQLVAHLLLLHDLLELDLLELGVRCRCALRHDDRWGHGLRRVRHADRCQDDQGDQQRIKQAWRRCNRCNSHDGARPWAAVMTKCETPCMKILFRLLLCTLAACSVGCAHQPPTTVAPAEATSGPAPLLLISIDAYRHDYIDRGF